ncbi:Uncharacterised protein (plasmid) [Legionella adelaidensis]|uniref:Uncharacterized protein n=1 Tax=Legionella adelaidensis TaxID=45056 RepID=A0A0W0R2Q6_9GAMM|nr:hypothetical protein [Legionella adelaidensis]KTC65359.1 hypothetical protein Lade_0017 [Legionella adelaidensis]VEH84819.1 Uncharacterised protein [Legionella adelaidensis]
MDLKQKKKIISFLITKANKDPRALIAIESELKKADGELKSSIEFDVISEQIAILKIIARLFPKEVVSIYLELLPRLNSIELNYTEIPNISLDYLKSIYTKEKLIIQIFNALETVRYHDIEKILNILFEYTIHEDEEVRKQATRGLEAIAQYNLEVFSGDGKEFHGLGWWPQVKTVEKIQSFSKEETKIYLNTIFSCIQKILSPSIEGASWGYDTVTLKTASVPPEEGLIRLRQSALILLKEIYFELAHPETKKKLLDVMLTATRFSSASQRTKQIEQMIIDNTTFVLQFMSDCIVESEDLQVLQTIEHNAYWLYYHLGSLSPDIKKTALVVKKKLDDNEEFQIFRVLIGFESIFHDWEGERKKEHFEQERKIREEKIIELVRDIDDQNYVVWKGRIFQYAAIRSNDMATFPYFGKFLECLGKESSEIAIQLLSEFPEELEWFIVPILRGVEQSPKKNVLSSLISSWIRDGVFFLAIARFLQFTTNFKLSTLKKLFDKAKLSENTHLLSQIIATSAAQHKNSDNKLISKVMIPTIEKCTELRYPNWIFDLWFSKEYVSVFDKMDAGNYDIVLTNLLWLKKIGHEAEEILLPIAEQVPRRIVQFFCDRIILPQEKSDDRFEALPFQFSSLSEPLSKVPEQIIELILSYKKFDDRLFTYNAARLLNLIFPKLEEQPVFEKSLIQLVNSGDDLTLFFIADILRGYDGNKSIYPICKELIKVANNNEDLLNAVAIALQSTGVVEGAEGFIYIYEERMKEIEMWLEEQNRDVILFAKNYLASLKRQIEAEKQRTSEDEALRRHQYGLDDEQK